MTEQTIITGIIHEEWRPISGYITDQASNMGKVKNVSDGNILQPQSTTTGYLFIGLYNEQVRKKCYLHKLVAQEFIDNAGNRSEVVHIDNN